MTGVLDLFSLTGKTAVVTGGTRGIGRAMALALAEAGADIILLQRSPPEDEDSTFDTIRALGRKCSLIIIDLSDPDSISATIQALTKPRDPTTIYPTADARIDILLNCAGIQARHPSQWFPTSDWNSVLQVNLNATFQLCRDIGAHMLGQQPDAHGRRGSIVNIASLLSFQGGLTVPAYAASKGAVVQMTKALSNEWAGQGISVNCIAPGYVATEMNEALMRDRARARSILERIPAGRWGMPDDFKGAIVFLASRAAAYVSGETLVVDGGWMGR